MTSETVDAAIEKTVRELVGRARSAHQMARLLKRLHGVSSPPFLMQRNSFMTAARDVAYRMRYELQIHPYDQLTKDNSRV